MAHNPLHDLLLAGGEEASSNEAMVQELERSGVLKTTACSAAFRAVDRRHFWVEGGRLAYTDAPLRHGRLHQSAPHIYARALEALMPLGPGLSFLNVGSGTGYFSSVVHELTGDAGINDGVELWPEPIAHAKERCRMIGKRSIEFTQGSAYQLDPNMSMRYDRIYIGACVGAQGRYLYGLLEVGGILVGPFQVGSTQHLRRVERLSETRFHVEILNMVHFASLVEPPATGSPVRVVATPTSPPAGQVDHRVCGIDSDGRVAGLPGVPFTFALHQQPWCMERSWAYPLAFKAAVAVLLRGRTADPMAVSIPAEIWQKYILPCCPRWWFQQQPTPAQPGPSAYVLSLLGATLKRALSARGKGLRRGSWDSDGASTRAPSLADGSPGSGADSPVRTPSAETVGEAEPSEARPGELATLLVLAVDGGEGPAHQEARWAGARWRRGLAGALRGGCIACVGALQTTGRCFVAMPRRSGLRRGCYAAVQGARQLRGLVVRCVAAVCV